MIISPESISQIRSNVKEMVKEEDGTHERGGETETHVERKRNTRRVPSRNRSAGAPRAGLRASIVLPLEKGTNESFDCSSLARLSHLLT